MLTSAIHEVAQRTGSEAERIRELQPVLQQYLEHPDWVRKEYFEADPAWGYSVHPVHEEPDHTLAVLVACWLPGRGTLPHNHGTWTIFGGVAGEETNTFWRRLDTETREGFAEIEQSGALRLGEGEAKLLGSDDIHSVVNEGSVPSLTLNLFGRSEVRTRCTAFHPEERRTEPYPNTWPAPQGHVRRAAA